MRCGPDHFGMADLQGNTANPQAEFALYARIAHSPELLDAGGLIAG
jgi:hypothetical protein